MRSSWKVYLLAGLVFVVSFTTPWIVPTEGIFSELCRLPSIAALLAALYQVIRDQAAHERALDLQERQNVFDLGAASHMANTAFDKHVEMAEQYTKRMQKGLEDLVATGPRTECLNFCSELAEIRLRYRLWTTEEVQGRLLVFEKALRQMGASRLALQDLASDSERKRISSEMYRTFLSVTGLKIEEPIDDELAPGRIFGHLQDILGIPQLIKLRQAIIQEAIGSLERKD